MPLVLYTYAHSAFYSALLNILYTLCTVGVLVGWDQAEYTVAEDQTLTVCVSVQSGTFTGRVVAATQAGSAGI